MKFKLNALLAASVVALAAGGAQAAVDPVGAGSFGNSSLLFVAIDANNNTALTIDLGLNMSSFVPGSSRLASGTSINWNFGNNTSSDASITGNSWSEAFNTFVAAQSGGDYRWGVIAGDSVNIAAVSATNTLAGRGVLATGNVTQAQMLAAATSAPTGNALTAINNFYAANSPLGTLTSANNGAAATDANGGAAGGAYLDTTMKGNFSGFLTWNYLLADGEQSTFQYQQQIVANPVVFQLGAPSAADGFSSAPATFSFNLASGELSYAVAAVPEPETYAMLLAGLAAIGAMVRRRKA